MRGRSCTGSDTPIILDRQVGILQYSFNLIRLDSCFYFRLMVDVVTDGIVNSRSIEAGIITLNLFGSHASFVVLSN